jgi:hypothetical protein
MLSRRGLLLGLVAAPAVIRTPGLLMPVKKLIAVEHGATPEKRTARREVEPWLDFEKLSTGNTPSYALPAANFKGFDISAS